MNKYDDIINLPHHRSKKHPQMSTAGRAAQFSSFEALAGHRDAIKETERRTKNKIELDDYEKELIDRELMKLADISTPCLEAVYFVRDEFKKGGKYVTYSGKVKKVDMLKKLIIAADGTIIHITDIKNLKIFEKNS